MGLQPQGNIPDRHDGGFSVFKFVLTDQRAKATKELLERHRCSVQMTTERQTADQAEERGLLAGALKDTSVFPCELCPGCAWFDPLTKGYCGADTWPVEAADGLLKRLPKARKDLDACPVYRSDG